MIRLFILLPLILVGCGGGGSGSTPPPPPPPPPTSCSAVVTWAPTILRVNGEVLAIEDILKYSIYVSKQNNTDAINVESVIDISDVNVLTHIVRNLSGSSHWFYITVTDGNNLESTFSNIKIKICN